MSSVESVPNPAQPPREVKGRRRGQRRFGLALALPIAALVLSGCNTNRLPGFGATPGDTTSSRSVYHLWQGFSVAAVIVGLIVIVLMSWSIIAHRRTSDAIPRQTQYHLPLEVVYTVIPILMVFGLFAATLVVENRQVANPATSVNIDVNAFQWGWEFLYPGTNALVVGQTTQDPVMVMPSNVNVHITLTSTDVLHGFYVHDFNFSRYALPGVANQFTFNAVQNGTYFGQCTQLCGMYHSLMYFKVKVVSPADYQQWLRSFNSAKDAAAAKAAMTALQQVLATGVPSKITNSSFGGN